MAEEEEPLTVSQMPVSLWEKWMAQFGPTFPVYLTSKKSENLDHCWRIDGPEMYSSARIAEKMRGRFFREDGREEACGLSPLSLVEGTMRMPGPPSWLPRHACPVTPTPELLALFSERVNEAIDSIVYCETDVTHSVRDRATKRIFLAFASLLNDTLVEMRRHYDEPTSVEAQLALAKGLAEHVNLKEASHG